MRILVTGAGGFVGRKLVSLLADHQVIAIDQVGDGIPGLSHVTAIAGDLRDTNILDAAFAKGCDAVVHLATVPGGAAEMNPQIARTINVEATMALADFAVRAGNAPRFVFASSIAALGDSLPGTVNDDTPLLPTMLYGAHKAMMEQWLATLARRGDLDAISLRLSGVIARPRGPSGMKSAFLSDIFHALRNGERFKMPVSKSATSWLTSIDIAACNFAYAITADLATAPLSRAITLPAMHVRIADMVTEIASQTEQSVALVNYCPDAKIESMFGAQPPLTHQVADKLGFSRDVDLSSLIRNALIVGKD